MGDEAQREAACDPKVSAGHLLLALGVGGLVGLAVGAAVAGLQAEDNERSAEQRGFLRGWAARGADLGELYGGPG